MFDLKYRPQKFGDVVGQDLAVAVLKSTVKHPYNSPRCFILAGEWGLGKTTLARVFHRAINCISKKSADPCLECESCKQDISMASTYMEIDSTKAGNVEFSRNLCESVLSVDVEPGKYRVIVFDEVHASSAQAQDALLKITEEVPERTFFMFCTTQIEKLKNPIRSRSIELNLNSITYDDMLLRLKHIATIENINITDTILIKIAQSSSGHLRDALKRLYLYTIIDDSEEFEAIIETSEKLLLGFLYYIRQKDKAMLEGIIEKLCCQPLNTIKRNFEYVIVNLLKTFIGLNANP